MLGGTVGTLLSSDTRTPKWLAQAFLQSGDRSTLVWENPNAVIKKFSLYKERGENEGRVRATGQ